MPDPVTTTLLSFQVKRIADAHVGIEETLPAFYDGVKADFVGRWTAAVRSFSQVEGRASGDYPYRDAEMLGEFRVASVENSASAGQIGDVGIITRGGANQLHGSALWYHRNTAMDTKTFGAIAKQQGHTSAFGGSFGC